MKIRLLSTLSVVALLLTSIGRVAAFETDQFNLSPIPLGDIGDEVSQYIEARINEAVTGVNAEIGRSLRCTEAKAKGCGSAAEERKRLGQLRSEETIVKAVFQRLGDGNIFRTSFGRWVNSHEFQAKPARYKTSYFGSIYVGAPANYFTISPTINMYGVEFGTDKLEHLFQQGSQYYRIEREQLSKDPDEAAAARKAVEWGKRTERTYYGLLASGVYSNADLYANYAGMRFYDGLVRPVNIGDAEREPLIEQVDGLWRVKDADSLRQRVIKPFISEHLNEALNPSGYAFTIFASVRAMVRKKACDDWHRRFPELTAAELDQKAFDLELWHDEDYGNMVKGRLLKLSEVCFNKQADAK